MKMRWPRLPKPYLLLVAGIVWFFAGFNIVRIGLQAATRPFSLLSAGVSLAVFILFFGLIFRRMVGKHTRRILGYAEERVMIFRFFDGKAYAIMTFMITFGILLRRSNWWPPDCIAMFYTGLGSSLIAAGFCFVWRFRTAVRGRQTTAEAAEYETPSGKI